MTPRLLFLSHAAQLNGAPISLMTIIEYIHKHTPWETRLILRKNGPLRQRFNTLLPTDCFSEYADIHLESDQGVKQKQGQRFSQDQHQRQYHHEKKLLEHIKQWNPTLIYSNTAMNGDLIDWIDSPAPVIVHVRELETSLNLLGPKRIHSFKNKPNTYLAVSSSVKTYLTQRFNIPSTKINIAPVALSTKDILGKAKEYHSTTLRKELGISPQNIIVGGAGSVDHRKGADLFVQIAKKVLSHLSNSKYKATFIWTGTGPLQNSMVQEIQALGLEQEIQFIGAKENPYPFLQLYDILLTTSRDDPFPRVNLEAGLLGAPTVAFTDSGGSSEYIEQDCGFLINNWDTSLASQTIIKLIQTPRLLQELGSQAKKKVLCRYDESIVVPNIIHEITKNLSLSTKTTSQRRKSSQLI